MSEFVRIVRRHEQPGPPLFEPLRVHLCSRSSDDGSLHERLGDEAVEIALVERGIDPHVYAG